jgi:rod shape determining protein RodA
MFDRRLAQSFDWGLLTITLLLSAVGLTTLYSAVSSGSGGAQPLLYYKQLIWFAGGGAGMVLCFLVSYRSIERWTPACYVLVNLLLLYVVLFGRVVSGARRWIFVGPFSLQPSELAKLVVILILARYYAKHVSPHGLTLRELIQPVLSVLLPFGLIVVQPDLGTALMLGFIAVSMTLFVKIERRALLLVCGCFVVLLPSVWLFLKGYQRQRILTFLNPERDPLGTGYHIIQSKIAIGSGMISGKGFLQGTQNALSFLPEQHTDFIFSVLAEEWGFMGSMLLVLLFLVLLLLVLHTAYRCRDPYGTILVIGVGSMLFWQVLINIGMVMGLMPVVGVPLPFVSYGGSSVLTTLIGVGLLLNVSMRRFLVE